MDALAVWILAVVVMRDFGAVGVWNDSCEEFVVCVDERSVRSRPRMGPGFVGREYHHE